MGSMEASLLDLTRGLDRYAGYAAAIAFQAPDHAALEVEIEVVEYVFDHAPNDTLADAWFVAHDDEAPATLEEPVTAAAPARGLYAILCFGMAVLLAACWHASSL